jgi:hypothetical protein
MAQHAHAGAQRRTRYVWRADASPAGGLEYRDGLVAREGLGAAELDHGRRVVGERPVHDRLRYVIHGDVARPGISAAEDDHPPAGLVELGDRGQPKLLEAIGPHDRVPHRGGEQPPLDRALGRSDRDATRGLIAQPCV